MNIADLVSPPLFDTRLGPRKPAGLRLLVALAIAAVSACISFGATRLPGFADQDFRVWWLGANAVLHGRNPYTTILYQNRPDFLYPLAAALVSIPFADMAATNAGPLFIAISCGLLAFAVTRTTWWPLLMFASGGMLLCMFEAQFSALLMLGFLFSTAMWLGALKPNIGVAMLAWRPSVKGATLMALVTAISLISMPSWPLEWLRALRSSTYHYAPVLGFGGPLILLALLRWRRPEARLLAVMALVPSSPLVYETLPLFLIARKRIEWCALSFASSVGYLLTIGFSQAQMDSYMERGRWVVVWFCYLPALVIVLRRPNEYPADRGCRATGPARVRCQECSSSLDPVRECCRTRHVQIARESPRIVLALGCAAVAIAFLLALYATFFHAAR